MFKIFPESQENSAIASLITVDLVITHQTADEKGLGEGRSLGAQSDVCGVSLWRHQGALLPPSGIKKEKKNC